MQEKSQRYPPSPIRVEVDTKYDATIRRADWFFDLLLAELAPQLAKAANLTGPPTADQLNQILLALSAQSVCAIHQKFCLGADQQVPSLGCLGKKRLTEVPISGRMFTIYACVAIR